MAKSKFRQLAGAAEELVSRTKESYQTRDSTGKYENILSSDIPLPEWKCKEGDHIIDVLPWIAGKNYPVKEKRGKFTYVLDIWVHQKIGVNENDYVCPARNYGLPCPICEDIAAIKKVKGYDEDYVKQTEPKRRVVYAIVVYDSPQEEQQSPYVWEASHFLTEKNISAIARNKRTGGFIPFANPDTGKSVEFTREGSSIGTKYVGYMLSEREYVIPDEILDAVPSLDEYIDIVSYEELAEIYYGGSGGAGDEGGECYAGDGVGDYDGQDGDPGVDDQGYDDQGYDQGYEDQAGGDQQYDDTGQDDGYDSGQDDQGYVDEGEDAGVDDGGAPPDEVAQEAEQQEEQQSRLAPRGGGRLTTRGAAQPTAKKAAPRQGRAPLRTAGNARIGRRQPDDGGQQQTQTRRPPARGGAPRGGAPQQQTRAPLRGGPAKKAAPKQRPAGGQRTAGPSPRTGTRLARRPAQEGG